MSLVYGEVEPGQKNVKSLKDLYRVWLLVEMSGRILHGHCTCMAGLGEVCSHVAAIMFAVMATVEQQGEESCTSKPCAWLAVKKGAPTAKINEIEFKKYKYGYTPKVCTATARTPAPSTDDSPHKELFNLIKENTDSSVLCTMLGKDGSSTDSASEGEENYVPSPFVDRLLYKGCLALVSYTSQGRAHIEKLTRGQAVRSGLISGKEESLHPIYMKSFI